LTDYASRQRPQTSPYSVQNSSRVARSLSPPWRLAPVSRAIWFRLVRCSAWIFSGIATCSAAACLRADKQFCMVDTSPLVCFTAHALPLLRFRRRGQTLRLFCAAILSPALLLRPDSWRALLAFSRDARCAKDAPYGARFAHISRDADTWYVRTVSRCTRPSMRMHAHAHYRG